MILTQSNLSKINGALELKNLIFWGKKRKLKIISYTGTIKSKLLNTCSSIILLKNAQFSNGTFKSSFNFRDKGMFTILFRYYDDHNYYPVKFDPKASQKI